MTWNDDMPDSNSLSLQAPEGSRELILARLSHFYPGSWLPVGVQQLEESAKSYFDLILAEDGRLDYIETLKRWEAATKNLYPWNNPTLALRAVPHFAKLAAGLATSKSARIQWQALKKGDQRTCFIESIMGHQRIVFRRSV